VKGQGNRLHAKELVKAVDIRWHPETRGQLYVDADPKPGVLTSPKPGLNGMSSTAQKVSTRKIWIGSDEVIVAWDHVNERLLVVGGDPGVISKHGPALIGVWLQSFAETTIGDGATPSAAQRQAQISAGGALEGISTAVRYAISIGITFKQIRHAVWAAIGLDAEDLAS
jgi:hypothetical protein